MSAQTPNRRRVKQLSKKMMFICMLVQQDAASRDSRHRRRTLKRARTWQLRAIAVLSLALVRRRSRTRLAPVMRNLVSTLLASSTWSPVTRTVSTPLPRAGRGSRTFARAIAPHFRNWHRANMHRACQPVQRGGGSRETVVRAPGIALTRSKMSDIVLRSQAPPTGCLTVRSPDAPLTTSPKILLSRTAS
jgi:hypothetical protein